MKISYSYKNAPVDIEGTNISQTGRDHCRASNNHQSNRNSHLGEDAILAAVLKIDEEANSKGTQPEELKQKKHLAGKEVNNLHLL